MMKLSKALMLSATGLFFMSCDGVAYANISTHASFNSPGVVTFVHTPNVYTSHPAERLLSSLELNSPPKVFSIYTLPKDLGQEARKQSCELFSNDWSRTVNLRASGSDAFANVTVSADRSKLAIALAELTPPEVREGFNHSSLLLTSPFEGRGRHEVSGEGDKHNIHLAAACFVTDTTECSGNTFSPDGDDESGSGDYGLDPEERCKKEGYTLTECPEGQSGINFCPYDNKYFEKCGEACPNNYVTCNAPYQGVGDACGNKYASCCNTCEGYDFTSIPENSIADGEPCESCDGLRYKVICDTSQYVTCETGNTTAGTCSDATGTYYKECDCPSNYEWNATSKSCVCSTLYKYTCVGDHITGGDGQTCNSQYASCICETGYKWDEATGKCVSLCDGIEWCQLPETCSDLGYAQQSCDGVSIKCPLDDSYVYCLL